MYSETASWLHTIDIMNRNTVSLNPMNEIFIKICCAHTATIANERKLLFTKRKKEKKDVLKRTWFSSYAFILNLMNFGVSTERYPRLITIKQKLFFFKHFVHKNKPMNIVSDNF